MQRKYTDSSSRSGVISKAYKFLAVPDQQKRLYVEAYCLLGWARILKWLPFSKIAPKLGAYMQETPYMTTEEQLQIQVTVSRAVRTMSKYTLWESRCLVMAIAAMTMLAKRGISSTLYMGTAREADGRLTAHAWLRSGNRIWTGAEGMERYTVVGQFANYANKASGVNKQRVN